MNPFTNRGAITNPDDFFGRTEQLTEIITRLQRMQSSSVVGERRIGKSSLLYYLMQTGAKTLGENYSFLYLDMRDAHNQTASGFFQSVLKKLGLSTEVIKEDNKPNRNLIAFTDELENLEQQNRRAVLCLDDFANTFRHRDQFSEDFFDHMRSKLQLGKFAFVTATKEKLRDLCEQGKLVSQFYNVFTPFPLGELTTEEAQQFVATYHERITFSEDELKFVFSWLDQHPLKLQIICDWMIRNRERQYRDEALIDDIEKDERIL